MVPDSSPAPPPAAQDLQVHTTNDFGATHPERAESVVTVLHPGSPWARVTRHECPLALHIWMVP